MKDLVDRRVSESPPNARFVARCRRDGCEGVKQLGRQYFIDKAGEVTPSSVVARMRCAEPHGPARKVCGSAMVAYVWFFSTFKPTGPLSQPGADGT